MVDEMYKLLDNTFLKVIISKNILVTKMFFTENNII